MAARHATVDHFFPEADFAEIELRLREIPALRRPRSSRSLRETPRGSLLGFVATLTIGFGVAIPTSSLLPPNPGGPMSDPRGLGHSGARASEPPMAEARTISSEPIRGYARGFTDKNADPSATGSIARTDPAFVPSRYMHAVLSAGLEIFGLPGRP